MNDRKLGRSQLYKETNKYGLVVDDIYWNKALVKKIKNLVFNSKKDLLKLTKNNKHKITIQEIEDVFNIKIIEIKYKFENQKTYRNQLLINNFYSEALAKYGLAYKGFNNDLNQLKVQYFQD